MIPLSILDLVPVKEGATPRDALAESLELARQAERLGYRRYWVAEHHNMAGIASAFASHFAPDALPQALRVYRAGFQPGPKNPHPYAMVGINVVAAETDAEARRLFTSIQLAFLNIFRDTRGPFPRPIEDIETHWTPQEKASVSAMLRYSLVGPPATVRAGLERLLAEIGPDEVMVASHLFDPAARVRSYALLAEVARDIA